jgi:hypothetical protein
MKISLSILFLLLMSAAILQAQEAVFITQPAAQKVGINDKFEVKFVLKNISNAQGFLLSPMPDFEVIDRPSRSNNASIINGEVSQSLELTYVFKAKRKGKLVIPGGIATLSGGKQIRSNNVAIEIVDGSVANRRQQQKQQNDPFADMFDDEEDPMLAMLKQQQQMMRQLQLQPQQNFPQASPQQQPNPISRNDIDKNIFILAIPDKTSATLGEQITVSYKLYTRIPMDVRPTNRPSLIGFWSQDFNIPYPPQARREIYQGKEWNVLELKRTALFPTQTGILELDPAEAEGNVKIPHARRNTQQNTPGQTMEEMMDALMNDDPYEYETVPVKLKSQVVKINVINIPIANKPATFNGAIGTYNIESNINKTENTRVAYPIELIDNIMQPSIGDIPKNIFFLTADAFGVLPPISKLSPAQAMYHFISGYTAKVAGTEVGITEPQVTFSACFGKAFLPLHPTRYAELLGKKLKDSNVNVWLINTGWCGGPYGIGSRIKLKYTRAMISAALRGELDQVEYIETPYFKLKTPVTCPEVPSELLFPRNAWDDKDKFDQKAVELAEKFVKNFSQYADFASSEILAAAPKIATTA